MIRVVSKGTVPGNCVSETAQAELTSAALQTRVPASGSYLSDTVPQKFFIVISEMVRFACQLGVSKELWQGRQPR